MLRPPDVCFDPNFITHLRISSRPHPSGLDTTMPKAEPETKPHAIKTEPYQAKAQPQTPTKASTTVTHSSPSGTRAKARPLSGAERVKLFEAAQKNGVSTKSFEGVLEGRSGKSCYDNYVCVLLWAASYAWLTKCCIKTIEPMIKRFLRG